MNIIDRYIFKKYMTTFLFTVGVFRNDSSGIKIAKDYV